MLVLGKKISRYLTLFIGLFLALVCLFGCDSKQRIPIERIYFPNKTYEAVVGETFKMEPIIEPANAYTGDLRWYTGELDQYTASVDDDGNVTAHHIGNVSIHVCDQNNHAIHAFYELYVSNPPSLGEMRASIEDSLNEIAVSSKSRLSINFSSSPIDGYVLTKRISITSQDSSIAEVVIENGIFFIQGKKVGKTTLHIVDNYKRCKDLDYEITVKEPYLRAITLPNEYIYLISSSDTYKSFDLKPQSVALGNVNAILSFSSSDSTVVSVDNKGHLLAKKEGKATITVSSGSVSTTCEVIVSEDNSKLPAEGAIKLGDTQEERFAITALLERYAYEHFVAGLPILATESDEGIQSPIKLNLNTCSEREWERYFGVAGSAVQTQKEDYWEVEPAMSNHNFLKGLSLAINRVRLAEKNNKLPCVNLMHAEMISNDDYSVTFDTSYLESSYHKAVINDLVSDTDGYGYSFERAKQYFIDASNELINKGFYKSGDVVEIEIAWSNYDQLNDMHRYIKEDLEKAFNNIDNPLTLKVNSYLGDNWSDVYYKKAMVGKYDISFGSISSSTSSWRNNPLACSLTDTSRNYWCLNFGEETNDINGEIVYKNKIFSFESLLTAVYEGVFASRGMYYQLSGEIILDKSTLFYNDDNQLVFDCYFNTPFKDELIYLLDPFVLEFIYYESVENRKLYLPILPQEIKNIDDLTKDEMHYQIIYSKESIDVLKEDKYETAYYSREAFFDWKFAISSFNDAYSTSSGSFVYLDSVVDNYSDLFI